MGEDGSSEPEEVHSSCRRTDAVGGDEDGTKPKEALPRRYDAEMYAALKRGAVKKIFTGGNSVVWPEKFRKVWYYYEMEKEMLKSKPHWKALAATL